MMKRDYFESVRQKYKPEVIKFLPIAEAPPEVKYKRFFYFEDVKKYDNLFIETMKVLYPSDCSDTEDIRQRKGEFLERFKNDRFYLIDASDKPIRKDTSLSKREKQIKESLPSLRRKS